MKLTSILIILLFAFTLAACGGGGSSGPAPETPMMDDDDGGMDDDMAMEECPAGHTGTYPDCVDPAVEAAEQARIMGLTAAIADSDGDDSFAGELNNSKRPGEDITPAAGGAITVDDDELGKNDTDINNAREFQPKQESRISLSKYKSNVHERTTADGKTDTITVYTNVAAAKSQGWNVFYSSDGNGVSVETNPAVVPTGTTSYNLITISAEALSANVAGRIEGLSIGRSIETGNDNAVRGMYHGVPGAYTCSSGTCTLTEATNGAVTLTGGDLVFTPSNTKDDTQDKHMIEGALPDTDYLLFGYWEQTMGSGEDMKYGVGVFHGGIRSTTPADTMIGSASYDGEATGLYAKKDLELVDGEVVGTPSAVGQFSADVSLTAHFNNTGGDSSLTADQVAARDAISASEMHTISGTVDNFQDADGMIDDSWSVSLNRASFMVDDNLQSTFSGSTGEGQMAGQWSGGFFEAAPADDSGNDNYPMGVSGSFTGHFSDGHVIGAFGATR